MLDANLLLDIRLNSRYYILQSFLEICDNHSWSVDSKNRTNNFKLLNSSNIYFFIFFIDEAECYVKSRTHIIDSDDIDKRYLKLIGLESIIYL